MERHQTAKTLNYKQPDMSEITTDEAIARYNDNSDVEVNLERPMFNDQHVNARLVKFLPGKGPQEGESFDLTFEFEDTITDENGTVYQPGKEHRINFVTRAPSDWSNGERRVEKSFQQLGELAKRLGTLKGPKATKGAILSAVNAGVSGVVCLSFKVGQYTKPGEDTATRIQNVFFGARR